MTKRFTSQAEADVAYAMAFQAITTSAVMLRGADIAQCADQLRQSANMAWFIDPTTMRDPRNVQEIEAKQRLLDAAAAFLREIDSAAAALPGQAP